MATRLWPDHCIQGTKGCELIPELDLSRVDHVAQKGKDRRVEMYSAFRDPFGVHKSEVAGMLKARGVTHVFVCGLAADYCVKYTALDSVAEGFKTYVVRDATKGVDPKGLEDCYRVMEKEGVVMIDSHSKELEFERMCG